METGTGPRPYLGHRASTFERPTFSTAFGISRLVGSCARKQAVGGPGLRDGRRAPQDPVGVLARLHKTRSQEILRFNFNALQSSFEFPRLEPPALGWAPPPSGWARLPPTILATGLRNVLRDPNTRAANEDGRPTKRASGGAQGDRSDLICQTSPWGARAASSAETGN